MNEQVDLSARVERVDSDCAQLKHRIETLEVLLQDVLLRMATGPEQPSVSGPATAAFESSRAPRLSQRYLVVRVHDRLFGVPVDDVREVVRMATLGSIPESDHTLEGLLDLRGESVPVMSLRVAFGFEKLRDDLDCRIVIVSFQGRTHGLKVDDVLTVESIDPADVAPPPELSRSSYVAGMVRPRDEQILLLDPMLLIRALSLTLEVALPATLPERETQ